MSAEPPAEAALAPEEGRTSHRRLKPQRRWPHIFLVVVLIFVTGLVADLMLIKARISKVDVVMPSGSPGETWVIVGSDSRAALPPGLSAEGVGSATDVPSSRADIVVVIHRTDAGTSMLSIPRDMLLRWGSTGIGRLALSLTRGPQVLVDALCDLSIPADHLIIFDFSAFITLVDLLGGVTVQIDFPTRDVVTGLDIAAAGSITLTGLQALALARSRHPEHLENGVWVGVPDGATQRTSWAGELFSAIRTSINDRSTDPVLLQRLAWTLSGKVVTDTSTSLFDLLKIVGSSASVIDLPATANPGVLAVSRSAETDKVLAAAGFDRECVAHG
ncbi:LytR family transcriptional regulator [Nakamurella antarctica]|uniref:LytR family transcriptional regulator n=1 Tax=Nakamurella antarctica TaxID=1902245 RepID=A0A3G8ZYQ5_9ACTN|nr:LCP family protein [Nakamurella antarctica]AZI59156.1 LytR family transcriptional regulator [Nakamurella antarctica]